MTCRVCSDQRHVMARGTTVTIGWVGDTEACVDLWRPDLERSAAPVDHLTITCFSIGHTWVLVLRGSLDAGSVIALSSQFDQLATGEFDDVIVDVSGLTALDGAGASALSALGERVGVVGAELRLKNPGGTISCHTSAGIEASPLEPA